MYRFTLQSGGDFFTQMHSDWVQSETYGSVMKIGNTFIHIKETPEVVLARFRRSYSPSYPHTTPTLEACYE